MKVLSPVYFIIQGEPLYEDFDDYEYWKEEYQEIETPETKSISEDTLEEEED